jgi:hypothetical protein
MVFRSWISPMLLAAGFLSSGCAEAQPPPPPLGAGADSQIEPATTVEPATTAEPPTPGGAPDPTEPGGPQTGAPTPSLAPTASPSQSAAATSTVFEAEDQELDGQYVETVTTPFSGVALYATGDSISFEHEFSVPGAYRADLTGASSNTLSATGELRLDTRSAGRFAFQGTTTSVQSIDFSVQTAGDEPRTLTVTATNDNNTWDLFIDQIEITFVGDAPNSSTPSSSSGF